MKALALVISIIILCTLGCVRYHNRLFVLDGIEKVSDDMYETSGQACGQYLIHPKVLAYRGSYGAGPSSRHTFSVWLHITDTSDSEADIARMRIADLFPVDQLRIVFGQTGEERLFSKIRSQPARGKGPGLVYLFGAIDIPMVIDSLSMVVPLGLSDGRQELAGCDTVVFEMHRMEWSKWGLWVGD